MIFAALPLLVLGFFSIPRDLVYGLIGLFIGLVFLFFSLIFFRTASKLQGTETKPGATKFTAKDFEAQG